MNDLLNDLRGRAAMVDLDPVTEATIERAADEIERLRAEDDMETRLWRIIDRVELRAVPSDIGEAVSRMCAEIKRLRTENERLALELDGLQARFEVGRLQNEALKAEIERLRAENEKLRAERDIFQRGYASLAAEQTSV